VLKFYNNRFQSSIFYYFRTCRNSKFNFTTINPPQNGHKCNLQSPKVLGAKIICIHKFLRFALNSGKQLWKSFYIQLFSHAEKSTALFEGSQDRPILLLRRWFC
jgi:hypothetical protein